MPQTTPGQALFRLFEETSDAQLLVAGDGRVVLVNRRCEELFGWDREDLLGGSSASLVPEPHRAEMARLRDRLLASGSDDSVRFEVPALHRGGAIFPIFVTARRVRVGSTVLVSLVVRTEGDERGLRTVLDGLLDANVVVDARGRIVMANPEAEGLFGYAESELVDLPVEVLVPEGARAEHPAHRKAFEHRAGRHAMGMGVRVLARRKDGTEFPVLVVLSSLGAGEERLVSATVRDLTGVEELVTSNSRLRAQFLATVSHELRTPLTTIAASAEMLQDDLDAVSGLDDAARQRLASYVERIERAAARELTLIDDLLTVTSLEADDTGVAHGLADVVTVARTAAVHAEPKAAARGVAVHLALDPGPVLVEAHEGWLTRAVGCLLDNGIKFTPAGGTVGVAVTSDHSQVVVTVEDSGPGIMPGDEELVFEHLYRGENAVRQETPGSGLGLSMARSIVEGAGGTLVARPGSPGACLVLTLPLGSQRG